MKKTALLLPAFALILALTPFAAEPPDHDTGCPAHQAAEKGFKTLQNLHHVMAPAWHNAYPEKDYIALGEACVKFEAMIPEVKEMPHNFKTMEREKKFDAARSKFLALIEAGLTAKQAEDNESLYNIFPDLHENFERMAFYLLPLQFPEYQSLRTVVDLMIDTHLENRDYEAIASSIEALKIKNEMLMKAALPEDLKSVEKKVAADIAGIDEMCRELEAACGSTSTEKIDDCLKKLKILCDKFEQDYI